MFRDDTIIIEHTSIIIDFIHVQILSNLLIMTIIKLRLVRMINVSSNPKVEM